MRKISRIILICISLFLFCSCGRKEEPKQEIRSIQYMKIDELATGNLRKFSGVIYAKDFSYASFEDIGGKVRTVTAQIGEKVSKGQTIATLDTEKFELDINNAQADLKKAEAQVVKAKSDYEREQVLFKKDVSFQKKLDTAKFEFEASESNEKSAKAKLGLAERNMRNTELKAPYDGFVGERLVEPNQVVNIGQKIFRIDAEGALEVNFDIPENLLKRVTVGMSGSVMFPGKQSPVSKCEISFLGTAAGKANSFPVKAIVIDPSAEVKPGMTAEVSLNLPIENQEDPGFIVPVKAILPGKEPRTGYVFVYDPKSSTLRKSEIHAFGSQGNFGIVKGEIKPGDIIATAGISFLSDGMKVKLYEPDKNKMDASGEQQ